MCLCRDELKEASSPESELGSAQEWREAAAGYCKGMDDILAEHISTLRAQRKRRAAPHADIY